MSTGPGTVVQLQWRVVRLSLFAAGAGGASLLASAMSRPLNWEAAFPGVMIGGAGLQIVYALQQERIAGVQRSHLLWRALSIALCAIGAGFIAFGGWTLMSRLAAS